MQPVRAPGPVPGGHGAEPTRRPAGVHPAQPLGVVAAITPWNFPAVAPVRKLGPALIAGNGVVLKPAPENSLTALALGTLLREAGLPDGVLSIVTGDGERVGAALVDDHRVAGVSFTGSTGVGRAISQSVSGRLGRVQLELGGKNAADVHSARDLSKVAEHITAAAIQASGQRCTAISRVIVHEEVADELVGLLTEAYSSYKVDSGWGRTAWWAVGQPGTVRTRCGIRGQGDRGGRRADDARPRGSRGPLLRPHHPRPGHPRMAVAREEIFGPVICVLRVDNEEDALRLVNDSDCGLAAVVFTEDLEMPCGSSRRPKPRWCTSTRGPSVSPTPPSVE